MEWITLAWKFRNEIAIGIIICILTLVLFYIKTVFSERNQLKEDVAKLQVELVAVQKQVTLNEDIAHAISKIKIQSNNYVRVVEATPSPASGSASTIIASGMFLPTLPAPNAFRNTSSNSK